MTVMPEEKTLLAVVSPVFNDWVCADHLVSRLGELSVGLPDMAVFLVDDGSTEPIKLRADMWPVGLQEVNLVRCGTNLGHQRAIAIGLDVALRQGQPSVLAVIDADGEDDPADIQVLLRSLATDTSVPSIVVAKRSGRTEALGYRIFYRLYKRLFRWLTGRQLDFGNFSVMTPAAARRLLFMPELWNHFPAAIMRSKVPVSKVPTDRSHRYHGSSRMNFVSLVNHGLAAMAAFVQLVCLCSRADDAL